MQNIKPLIAMYKMAGVPIDDDTAENINNMYNDPTGAMALNNVANNTPQFNNQTMGNTPMDDPMYDDMIKNVRGPPSDFHQSDVSQDFNFGRNYETRKK
jgi:hypothetical protein